MLRYALVAAFALFLGAVLARGRRTATSRAAAYGIAVTGAMLIDAVLISHDHHGDALRRRWDDPNLHRENGHPVVFPGAGSHSGAFVPGDYVVATVRRPGSSIYDRIGTWCSAWWCEWYMPTAGPCATNS